jgi:hypothetical protein
MIEAVDRNIGSKTQGQRLQRIRQLSRFMGTACLLVAALVLAGMAVYWFATPGDQLLTQVGLAGRGFVPPDGWTRFAAFFIAMLPAGTLIYGLINARNYFVTFENDEALSVRAATYICRFAMAVGASAILQPLVATALGLLLSWNGPPGTKMLALYLGTDTLVTLIFAGTLAVIAWVLRDAAAIADENRQFV